MGYLTEELFDEGRRVTLMLLYGGRSCTARKASAVGRLDEISDHTNEKHDTGHPAVAKVTVHCKITRLYAQRKGPDIG